MSARQLLLSYLQQQPALGKLHAYERYSKNISELTQFYSQGGVLAGGFLRWSAAKTQMYALGAFEQRHVFELVLIRGWNDAQQSQLVFDQAIEQLQQTFETEQRLDDWRCMDGEQFGFALIRNEPAMFGGVLTHYAVLRIALTK